MSEWPGIPCLSATLQSVDLVYTNENRTSSSAFSLALELAEVDRAADLPPVVVLAVEDGDQVVVPVQVVVLAQVEDGAPAVVQVQAEDGGLVVVQAQAEDGDLVEDLALVALVSKNTSTIHRWPVNFSGFLVRWEDDRVVRMNVSSVTS